MRTVVITGGTRGIGRGLALHYLRGGDRVVAVGSSPAAGDALLAAAARLGAGDRVEFVPADLSSAAAVTALAADLRARYPVIDALVLGAYRYEPRRVETAEGLERTFALYVLGRYLLADLLREPLERAERPVILNLCGTGGIKAGALHWDDLQLRTDYRPMRATMQGARANDLLGAGFATHYPDSHIRYVLYNPLFVDTNLAAPFRQPKRAIVGALARLFATPVERAIRPMVELLDDPPAPLLTARRTRSRVDLARPEFAAEPAARLYTTLAGLTTPA